MIARFDGQDAQAWDDVSLTHQFSRDGFLVFENYCGSDVCDALIVAANSLVAEVAQADDPAVFSTLSHAHASQSYFLDSAANVHFFFEEEAFDESGRLVAPVAHAINKIGHGLHDEVGVFDRFSRDSRLATLCATLGINTPRLVQSMYIFKQPRIGGEVVWHQDSTFLYTEPMSVIGLWVALQPATRANGCFWVLPGAHLGCIARRVTALECA